MPKKECHIQRSCDATASNMTVHPLTCPLYWPCQANGQFFHSQCIQSMLPSIPGKPLAALVANNLSVSAAVGCLKYSGPKTSITAWQNLYIDIRHVVSLIRTYSSTRSPGIPYASMRMAAMHFWYEENPSLPRASVLHSKYGS